MDRGSGTRLRGYKLFAGMTVPIQRFVIPAQAGIQMLQERPERRVGRDTPSFRQRRDINPLMIIFEQEHVNANRPL